MSFSQERRPGRPRTPNDRMTEVVLGANIGDNAASLLSLSHLKREHFPWWIAALKAAETNLRALRTRLEEMVAMQERRCPVCDAVVSGRADRVYCGSTCRQRARRRVLGAGVGGMRASDQV